MIIKKIPSKEIIENLKKEILEYGIPNCPIKGKDGKVTLEVFNTITKKLPSVDLDGGFDFSKSQWDFDRDRRSSEYVTAVEKILNSDQITNRVYYSKNSYKQWHTNRSNPGKRIYVIFTTVPGIFRYRDPKTHEIIDDYDFVGWTQREFIVDADNPLWHCVWSAAPRFSFGFNVKNANTL